MCPRCITDLLHCLLSLSPQGLCDSLQVANQSSGGGGGGGGVGRQVHKASGSGIHSQGCDSACVSYNLS